MSASRLFAAACGLWLVLWLPPIRKALESEMALHMVVQVPLLIALGVLLAAATRLHEPRWLAAADWLGIPGIVAVVLGTPFWMLPRALDQAVSDPRVDLVKFLSLPLLVGMPLGASWQRMPSLGRTFYLGQFYSQARRHRRPLSRRADTTLHLLSTGPARTRRLDPDRRCGRAGNDLVFCSIRWLDTELRETAWNSRTRRASVRPLDVLDVGNLAQSGPPETLDRCPLSGAKQASRSRNAATERLTGRVSCARSAFRRSDNSVLLTLI